MTSALIGHIFQGSGTEGANAASPGVRTDEGAGPGALQGASLRRDSRRRHTQRQVRLKRESLLNK